MGDREVGRNYQNQNQTNILDPQLGITYQSSNCHHFRFHVKCRQTLHYKHHIRSAEGYLSFPQNFSNVAFMKKVKVFKSPILSFKCEENWLKFS